MTTEQVRADLTDRRGWTAIGVMTAVVAATWVPQLVTPLGDNHIGRTAGRMALHVRNLQERGLTGSHLGADWQPYSTSPYAHHPPLMTMLDALFGLPPGFGSYEVLLPQMIIALVAIPAAAALLRGLGLRWIATLAAVGLMVVTGYYWVFSPVTFDIGLLLALSASVVHLRRTPDPSRRAIVVGCVTALLATLGSWPGIAVAAVLGLWLFAKRRVDRVTIAVGASMLLGVAMSLAYMIGVNGLDALLGQTEKRTSEGGFTVWQFIRRQGQFALAFLPVWYLLLLPFAVVAGLLDRRTRFYAAVVTAFAGVWVLVLNNGAFIHEYWAYAVLLPGLVGMGVLADRLVDRVSGRTVRIGAAVLTLGLAAGFAVMVFGPAGNRYVDTPLDAGRLVAEHAPAPGQSRAWYSVIPTPRWLVFYWDLPPGEVTPEILASRARPQDLVLLNLDRLPTWLPASARPVLAAKAVAVDGPYALVRAGDLSAAR